MSPRQAWPLGALALALLVACGASKADVRAAQSSGYATEFANVYEVALSTVRDYYPYLAVEDAVAGVIKTRWHPVRNLSAEDDHRQSDRPVNFNDPLAATMGGSSATKLYFIRVQVYVVGGDPWRVRVDGQASEWTAGGVPSPLYGANVPPWLRGRLNALRVEIHRKLKQYAVKLESTSTAVTEQPEEEPKVEVDQSFLGALPPDVLVVVVDALSAAKARDYQALGKVLHRDFVWSLGAPPGADQALIMWQADSSLLDRLIAVLEAGCAVETADRRVVCPELPADGYQAVFEKGADGPWKMVSFAGDD